MGACRAGDEWMHRWMGSRRYESVYECACMCLYAFLCPPAFMSAREACRKKGFCLCRSMKKVFMFGVCVCARRIPDPLFLLQSSNELISLGMYLKQVTAVWIINSRLYTLGHVIYVLVPVIVTAAIRVQAVLVLVVKAVVLSFC